MTNPTTPVTFSSLLHEQGLAYNDVAGAWERPSATTPGPIQESPTCTCGWKAGHDSRCAYAATHSKQIEDENAMLTAQPDEYVATVYRPFEQPRQLTSEELHGIDGVYGSGKAMQKVMGINNASVILATGPAFVIYVDRCNGSSNTWTSAEGREAVRQLAPHLFENTHAPFYGPVLIIQKAN